jgi:hypothetical protein
MHSFDCAYILYLSFALAAWLAFGSKGKLGPAYYRNLVASQNLDPPCSGCFSLTATSAFRALLILISCRQITLLKGFIICIAFSYW